MTARTLHRLAAVAAIGALATTGATGVASAAKPAKRIKSTQVTAVVSLPTAGPVAAGRYNGHPKGTGPGSAGGAECRAFADAVNGIVDQVEQDVMNDTNTPYDANAVIDGILGAGQARGCAFMTG